MYVSAAATMKDPIAHGLEILTVGLRPYVAERIAAARRLDISDVESELFDAKSVLLCLWENWNDVFRKHLTYMERSLVSELRESRNRWAHQHAFSEDDTFRFLDGVERLLDATGSIEASQIRELRLKSLKRLYESQIVVETNETRFGRIWPLVLCLSCAGVLDFALISTFSSPLITILAVLITILLGRIGFLLTQRHIVPATGPHECASCDRIIYTADCPYCQPARLQQLQAVSGR